ncbi:MAG: Gfo/Idh/MocA family oxidoreductase [Planctomycetota bacterium]
MKSPLKAAVVGAGQIAKQHLGALAAAPGVEIVGVCDLSPIMAESTADRFAVDYWTTDFCELRDRKQPDIVHLTTPPASHYPLAKECLLAGCHVFVEKPATLEFEQFLELKELAAKNNLWLIEDHNYQFNDAIEEMLSAFSTGELGEVRHVDVQICLELFGLGSRFADQDMPHPAMREPAGIVTDFLTHLCYLGYAFVGAHRSCQAFFNRRSELPDNPITEFQALIDAERGTAQLGLSSAGQPDSFVVSVQGTRGQISTNLFEVGTVRTQLLGGPQPLVPVRNALWRGRRESSNAVRSLWRKLGGGPGAYEGLWSLIEKTYSSLQNGGPPPVSMEQIESVNRLVHDIQQEVESPCVC